MTAPRVLDPACGPRMMWFNRADPRAVFGDNRAETVRVSDRSHCNANGRRVITIALDTLMDFRALPFPDATFRLVFFDPPPARVYGTRRMTLGIHRERFCSL